MDKTHNEVTADAIGTVVQAGTIGSLRLPEQRRPIPRQLPAGPRHFVGRAAELAVLDGAIGGTAVIGGAGGVGKTWLALRWAHTRLDAFPDGRLHIDLQGFAPGIEPLAPGAAVRSFLDALGVRPAAIPVSLPAQASLYRSLVAGRRLLIVLDNAEGEAQVQPLLPGSASCTVLVTSRRFLLDLDAGHGAVPVELNVLSEAESRALLAVRAGEDQLTRDPEAAGELLSRCGGLPLALATVAARAEQRGLPLARLAAGLREFPLGVRGVLSWSCRMLSADALTMFRLLGHAPGPDISLDAATSLAGISSARAVLRELEDAHLVQEHVPGRYRMHDLVRCFAAEQVTDHEPALRRLTDFYLHTTHAADELLHPHRRPLALPDTAPGCVPLRPADPPAAVAWLEAEHRCLLELQRSLAGRGWHRDVWRLARLMNSFHCLRAHLRDQVGSWERGLAAAEHLGDAGIVADAHRLLGNAYLQVCDYQAAATQLGQALRAFVELGDPVSEAVARNGLGHLARETGRHREALEQHERALSLLRARGGAWGEPNTLDLIGQAYAALGEPAEARTAWQRAVSLYHEQFRPDLAARITARLDAL